MCSCSFWQKRRVLQRNRSRPQPTEEQRLLPGLSPDSPGTIASTRKSEVRLVNVFISGKRTFTWNIPGRVSRAIFSEIPGDCCVDHHTGLCCSFDHQSQCCVRYSNDLSPKRTFETNFIRFVCCFVHSSTIQQLSRVVVGTGL